MQMVERVDKQVVIGTANPVGYLTKEALDLPYSLCSYAELAVVYCSVVYSTTRYRYH